MEDVEEKSPSSAEVRQQIEDLTAALAARDSFIALVGHELRNSVAPMLLLAEQFAVLATDPGLRPTVASRAAMLTRNLNKFVTTVDRVVEVADLRRGRFRLDLATVDMVEVVRNVCHDLEREAEAGGAELVIEADGAVTGLWDRARLAQIASNLVSNAIRYAGGGRIELAVHGRDREGELVVQDHGPGLDPAVLPRLFDPFDYQRAHRAGGFGIGLWVVKTLCNAMHGSVIAENLSGGGARFCVVLPRG